MMAARVRAGRGAGDGQAVQGLGASGRPYTPPNVTENASLRATCPRPSRGNAHERRLCPTRGQAAILSPDVIPRGCKGSPNVHPPTDGTTASGKGCSFPRQSPVPTTGCLHGPPHRVQLTPTLSRKAHFPTAPVRPRGDGPEVGAVPLAAPTEAGRRTWSPPCPAHDNQCGHVQPSSSLTPGMENAGG